MPRDGLGKVGEGRGQGRCVRTEKSMLCVRGGEGGGRGGGGGGGEGGG